MKIFQKESTPVRASKKSSASSDKESKGIGRKKAETPEKKNISASEIRERLAAHVDTSSASKNMAIQSSKKLGDGFMNPTKVEEVKVEAPVLNEKEDNSPNTKDLTLKSDIAQNDPKDTNTQEKLKTVLSRGAFNFNSKEREALEKILAN